MPAFSAYCKPSLPEGWPLAYYRSKRGGIAYHGALEYAYDDWVRRGRVADALLTYRDPYGDDDHRTVILRPDLAVLRIEAGIEYFDFSLSAEIEVDVARRTVRVRRLLCTSCNHWPEIFIDGMSPSSGSGGVAWLKRNEAFFQGMPFEVSFKTAVAVLFGPAWTAVVPLTAPRISDEGLASAEACHGIYTKAMAETWCPWGLTVGLYDSSRHDAATSIQRRYRGWRARMRTAFDPNTRIGAYYALREFRRMLAGEV